MIGASGEFLQARPEGGGLFHGVAAADFLFRGKADIMKRNHRRLPGPGDAGREEVEGRGGRAQQENGPVQVPGDLQRGLSAHQKRRAELGLDGDRPDPVGGALLLSGLRLFRLGEAPGAAAAAGRPVGPDVGGGAGAGAGPVRGHDPPASGLVGVGVYPGTAHRAGPSGAADRTGGPLPLRLSHLVYRRAAPALSDLERPLRPGGPPGGGGCPTGRWLCCPAA